ncbi:cystathionine beta-lyase [Orrella marina]|uniref:Cystathionine beta-lyase n=1 Tax=Orrella marina TaxID=2163011 RepID=A0A2R4XM02_9BURK|nr:cystathionine beta-lyase [Orrella marina]AWB34791.1 cystathionine beta-lyase [Orrella marina]
MTKHHLNTRLLHTDSADFDPESGIAPVSLPAIRTSTVRFRDLDVLDQTMARKNKGEKVVSYGIAGLDTHRALENVINTLEGGSYCVLNPSGLASIHLAFMSVLKSGDHVLVSDNVYGPVRVMHETLLKRLNIELTYFSAEHPDPASLIQPNTRMMYVESPGSLLMEMLDLPRLAGIAREHDIVLAIDNTWGAGMLYQPLALGADISVIAGTKYINGHSDVMLGAVVTNRDDLARQIHATQYAVGNSVSADDVWLALRGVKTMAVRLEHHARSALQVCEFLDSHPLVSRIYFPAWEKDPGHALWKRDCLGSNGLLSVSLNCSPDAAKAFVNALELFGIGFSWGGFESLVQWVSPGALEPHSYWKEPGKALVRLHIGLEKVEDLIQDLNQALDQISAS